MVPLILLAIYLTIGYFVINKLDPDVEGEIKGALIFIFPFIVISHLITRLLKKLGLNHKIWVITSNIFIGSVVITLIIFHLSTVFGD